MNPHFRLRQLPFPAKLVVTVFLLSVGLGYFSAMVQLHMKHSARDGNPLPGKADVIEVFAGLKPKPEAAEDAVATIDRLISGDINAPAESKSNMAPAFKALSKGWKTERGNAKVEEEREGERQGMLAWVRLKDDTAKKKAFADDKFALPAELAAKPITPGFLDGNKNLLIKKLFTERCLNCHQNNKVPDLDTYDKLAPFVTPPSTEVIDGKWVRSEKQTTVEKLTQSTHAHLLTFSILFGLTGLVFAFTSYPLWIRSIVAPVVLIAQVADVSCWWLARIPAPYGPLFAMSIMGTGAVVGMGLSAHIVLSLWNMYDTRGKAAIVLLLFGGAAAFGYVGIKVIEPALKAEKEEFERKKQEATQKAEPPKAETGTRVVSHLEQLLTAPRKEDEAFPFNGKGTMVPALFEKDSEFKSAIKDDPASKPKIEAERLSEQQALIAWVRLDNAAREKAYQDNALTLPKELEGKPFTKDFIGSGGVAIKDLLEARCSTCHSDSGEVDKYPLQRYEHFEKYFKPKK
jgi:hypothetical protein